MLLGIAIGLSKEWSTRLGQVTGELGVTELRRSVEHYPGDEELTSLLRAVAPQVVFLGLDALPRALDIVRHIATVVPGLQVVGVTAPLDANLLLDMMRAGVRELLRLPLFPDKVAEVMARVEATVEQHPPRYESTDRLYCFLPSKSGSGASTIAANAAFALSGLHVGRVLLADFDLSSGTLAYMLKLHNRRSVVDAAKQRLLLDEDLWRQHVSSLGNLDVLPAGAHNPSERVEPYQVRSLLDFTRRMYGAICTDLSGNLEAYSLAVMRQSRRIYLVATPEVASLHLAAQKYRWLVNAELGDRVSLLLNRCSRYSFVPTRQVEEVIGLPVEMSLPNDYRSVERALGRGRDVAPGTKLGREFARLASSMTESGQYQPVEVGRRFVEYFALVPARYTLGR